MHLYQRILLSIILVMAVEIYGIPAPENVDLTSNILQLHEKELIASSVASNGDQTRAEELIGVRDKRHIVSSNETPEIVINKTQSNETSFEEYEKEYLINLTKNLLEQFLHYDQYLSHLKDENSSAHGGSTSTPGASPGGPTPLPHSGHHTTPDVRVDNRILQQKLLELQGMNISQLEKVFNGLHRAAKDGVEDPGITSLCCNIG